MALVKMKDLLLRAQKENKGCGAFSVGNMEMVKGAIKAAEELDFEKAIEKRDEMKRLKNILLEV